MNINLESGVGKSWSSKLNIGPNFVGSQSFHFRRNDPLKHFTLKCKSKFYFLFWKLETPQLILQFCCLYDSNFEVSPPRNVYSNRQTSNFISSPRSGIAYLSRTVNNLEKVLFVQHFVKKMQIIQHTSTVLDKLFQR